MAPYRAVGRYRHGRTELLSASRIEASGKLPTLPIFAGGAFPDGLAGRSAKCAYVDLCASSREEHARGAFGCARERGIRGVGIDLGLSWRLRTKLWRNKTQILRCQPR